MAKEGNNYPFEIKDVEPELAEYLMNYYSEKTGFVTVGPKKYFFPHKFKEWAIDYYNMPVREDDTFVVSFPRSGTTWTQELVWLLQNNLDFEQAKKTLLIQRFAFVEYSLLLHPDVQKKLSESITEDDEKSQYLAMVNQPGAERLMSLPSPRFIKSHFPISLLPPTLLDKAKVVYVARDPRDVIVSLYHFIISMNALGQQENFESFHLDFIRGNFFFSPLLEHVKEAWNLRHHPNLMFIFYEELQTDLSGTIRKIASFLGKQYSDDQIEQLCDYLSFDNFKNNDAVNISIFGKLDLFAPGRFIRKGITGDWKNYFNDEMIEATNEWLKENLKDTDLKYPSFEL